MMSPGPLQEQTRDDRAGELRQDVPRHPQPGEVAATAKASVTAGFRWAPLTVPMKR